MKDGADSSAAKAAQDYLAENGIVSAQQSSIITDSASESRAEPSAASERNGLDLHPAPQDEKLKDADANGSSETGNSKESSSGNDGAADDEGADEKKGDYQFSKGAYFIGKCVWGKVSHSFPQHALLHGAFIMAGKDGTNHKCLQCLQGIRRRKCAQKAILSAIARNAPCASGLRTSEFPALSGRIHIAGRSFLEHPLLDSEPVHVGLERWPKCFTAACRTLWAHRWSCKELCGHQGPALCNPTQSCWSS